MRPTRNRDVIMKKILMALCMTMCLFTFNAFAQEEVRGIEIRYVKDEESDKLYNIECTNFNSIPVSVSLELWQRNYSGTTNALSQTKDFVLKPNESYVWKVRREKSGFELYEPNCSSQCLRYYVKYKAYKMQ